MGTSRRRWRSGGHGLRTWYGGLPAWTRAGVGLGAAALGAVLLIRPTTSLGVLALVVGFSCLAQAAVEVLDVAGTTGRRRRRWVAFIWLVLGVFVLVWPGLTVRLLAAAVGIGLIVNGISDIVGAKRAQGPLDSRIATALLGAATVGFGVLSLSWPDITMIVVAVAFGARLISTGVMQLWRILHKRPRNEVENGAEAAAHDARSGTAAGSSTTRRWFRTIGAALAVALATWAGVLSVSLHQGSRVTDAFYAAPRTVPSEPGRLIRSEPFTRGVPENATGYRILYTTTQQDGSATVASGLVVVPRKGAGDWPVVDWTHGTTRVARQCAPSLLSQPFESGALFVLPQVINHGWALVATDYIGLGTQGKHPYLIGRPSAHASLDAVRAARELGGARLGKKTVAWGHSQGGGAALWTGALAKDYAPDVHLSGVAALAPATNLPQLTSGLDKVTGGSVFGRYVIWAYAAQCQDVTWKQYVRPGAEVVVRQMSTRCLSGPDLFGSVLTGLATTADPEVLAKDPPARRSGRG